MQRPNKHYYQFYKGREDLFRFVIPFLRLGLENQEACLWVVSRSVGILEAIEAFRQKHDLMRPIEKGQLLILPAERWYLDRGHFSAARVLNRLKKFVREKERRGFSVFRWAGDLGWLGERDWDQFQAYEAEARRWTQTLRFTSLSAYPIERSSLAQAKAVLDHHDGVFLTKL